ncbi:MAG: alpha/beta hydrolase family protein, partial [Lachnospirales bacterium]
MTVGRTYFENLLDYNVYENIGGFDKDVLIIHGDADDIVPLSYSEQAVNEYYSATLEVISGAGHGFSGQEFEQAVQWTLEYLSSLTV